LLQDGRTRLTDVVALSGGRAEMKVPLPADLSGTVEVCAYRYAAGRPVRQSRVVYVRPAARLNVRAELDRPEYRPGETASLTLRLTDPEGRPAPGAVSLAAVDEAVFGIGGLPGDEQTSLTADPKLLRPVREVYPWSPSDTLAGPEGQRRDFEQALFARTAGRSDHDALVRELLPFLENDERVFRVLERPDWEELNRYDALPEQALTILRSEGGRYTLNATTHPQKVQETRALKYSRLELVKGLWVLYGSIIVVAVLVYLLVIFYQGDILAGLALIVALALALGLLFPSCQKVREASARTQALSDLKQLSSALYSYRDAHGKLPGPGAEDSAAPVRVRQWMPETLLWWPELVTDDQGVARLEMPLADSITTWRLGASAVTAEGRLGAGRAVVRVFQPFFVELNLPVALTRGDDVEVPAVVYNYLDRPQKVRLELGRAAWFESRGEASPSVDLKPGEVRAVRFPLRARQVGRHQFQVTAVGAGVTDAVRRPVEVVPEGRPVEQVAAGTLQQPADIELAVPTDAVEGSVKASLRLYPSAFSQLVEGLDNIFRMPNGCFEQTSSTTYPNVLALDYLRRTRQSAPAVEAKARGYIHLGCQRLLGFEVSGGGFDWFGRPPANRTLSAYGLMEFEDMARVHDVDPAVIARTREWLLGQRRPDGSWEPDSHARHGDALGSTAYVAWAVFGGRPDASRAKATLDYLRNHRPESIQDPHTLALVCNALLALDPKGDAAGPYLDRLESCKRTGPDGKQVWWEGGRSLFYGGGRSAEVECTALATLALLTAGRSPDMVRGALAWLVGQKDASGTWHSTQATVLALKALTAGTGKPLGGERERRIAVVLDGRTVEELAIPADQSDVLRQVDLSARLTPGSHRLRLAEPTGTATGFQAVLHYHVPDASPWKEAAAFRVRLAFDRTELQVGEVVGITATLANPRKDRAPMLLVELPVPAGFSVEDDLARLVESGTIDRCEATGRSVRVYLRGLDPGQELALRYRLKAGLPARLTVAPAVAYEYYNPDRRAMSAAPRVTVTARP
jgi:uncharacterized protein YfaS (alpha-2-macroglobulin family)